MSAKAQTALGLWRAGVAAVRGDAAMATALPDLPHPDQILAVGKAAGAMAGAALAHFGALPCLVVTKDGHGVGLHDHARLIESAHPVPDGRSLLAGAALRDAVAAMRPGSRLLLLVSGGASALAEDLVAGKTLDDLAALNRRLLASGQEIGAMNRARREISTLKGGGLLARFQGAAVDVLAISDVPGDDLAVIGSGIGLAPESAGFAYHARIIASNTTARDAAESAARKQGLAILSNAESLHGDLDRLVAHLAPRLAAMERGAIILGGEPTVTLPPNPGRGGRNQALGLALARGIAGRDDIVLVVAGTDGSDGPTDDAGAIIDGATWAAGAEAALARADSGTFLAARGALLRTGPTGTNVMDLLIALRG